MSRPVLSFDEWIKGVPHGKDVLNAEDVTQPGEGVLEYRADTRSDTLVCFDFSVDPAAHHRRLQPLGCLNFDNALSFVAVCASRGPPIERDIIQGAIASCPPRSILRNVRELMTMLKDAEKKMGVVCDHTILIAPHRAAEMRQIADCLMYGLHETEQDVKLSVHLYEVAAEAGDVIALQMTAMAEWSKVKGMGCFSGRGEEWLVKDEHAKHPLFPDVVNALGEAIKRGYFSSFAWAFSRHWTQTHESQRQLKDSKRFPYARDLWDKFHKTQRLSVKNRAVSAKLGVSADVGQQDPRQDPGEPAAAAPAVPGLVCCVCGEQRTKADFALGQLRKPAAKGRKCRLCTSDEGAQVEGK